MYTLTTCSECGKDFPVRSQDHALAGALAGPRCAPCTIAALHHSLVEAQGEGTWDAALQGTCAVAINALNRAAQVAAQGYAQQVMKEQRSVRRLWLRHRTEVQSRIAIPCVYVVQLLARVDSMTRFSRSTRAAMMPWRSGCGRNAEKGGGAPPSLAIGGHAAIDHCKETPMPPLHYLTRAILDAQLTRLNQETRASRALGLSPACHPKAAVRLHYVGAGNLILCCNTCGQEFARLKLAKTLTIS